MVTSSLLATLRSPTEYVTVNPATNYVEVYGDYNCKTSFSKVCIARATLAECVLSPSSLYAHQLATLHPSPPVLVERGDAAAARAR